MRLKGVAIVAVAMALVMVASGDAYGASFVSTQSHRHHKDPATFVTSLSPDRPSGLVAVGSGIYIEDWSTGNLTHWDSTHGLTLVTNPPTGGSNDGYIGMTSGTVGGLFTIYLISWAIQGLYARASPTINGWESTRYVTQGRWCLEG